MARVTVHDRRCLRCPLALGLGRPRDLVRGRLVGQPRSHGLVAGPVAAHATHYVSVWTGSGGPGVRCLSPGPPGPPGRDDDRRNIAEHYDLSNEFFALMLDETMTYSCAIFGQPGATLAEAQGAKVDRLCTKLELAATDHLVEIGSGWGGLAIHAATHYGCRVTTTTISDAQRTYVEKRVADAGLTDRITVLGLNWRRPHRTGSTNWCPSRWSRRWTGGGTTDSWPSAPDLLADDGLAAIQAIVIDDRSFERAKHHGTSCAAWSSPAGCHPSVASLTRSVARATDLRVVDLEDIGRHYAETLRRWSDNLAVHTRRGDEPSEWARSSAVSGTSTWPTARRRSSNATSAMSSSSWPSRAAPASRSPTRMRPGWRPHTLAGCSEIE